MPGDVLEDCKQSRCGTLSGFVPSGAEGMRLEGQDAIALAHEMPLHKV